MSQRQGITPLFLYTGSVFLASDEAAGKVAVTRAQLGNFNLAAHALGLKVHAVDGDPACCLLENYSRVLARLAHAIDFNHRQAAGARLDGFQWDIEPHGLAIAVNTFDTTGLAPALTLIFTRSARDRCVLESTTRLAADAWTALATYDSATLSWANVSMSGAANDSAPPAAPAPEFSEIPPPTAWSA